MDKIHLYDKILSPVVTEKSTNLSELNKITFKVPDGANKKNLKKNIEKIFKVNVTKINIINKLEISNSLIILDKNSKDKIEKSVRNIPNVKVTDVNHFSAYDIIKFKKVVFTESSVKELEKRYS
jgi:ribosomal protein L23